MWLLKNVANTSVSVSLKTSFVHRAKTCNTYPHQSYVNITNRWVQSVFIFVEMIFESEFVWSKMRNQVLTLKKMIYDSRDPFVVYNDIVIRLLHYSRNDASK